MDYEQKYNELLELVTTARRLERSLKNQYSGAETTALKNVRVKIDAIVNKELHRSQKLITLFK